MKPILFNTEMVRAIMEGRKTVTRRVVKNKDIVNGWDCEADGTPIAYIDQATGDSCPPTVPCPYHPGDILWVRETWQEVYETEWSRERPYTGQNIRELIPNFDDIPKVEAGISSNCTSAAMKPRMKYYVFKASDITYADPKNGLVWRPSIHMPKEAARLFLQVTGVRVERLRDITEEGAIAEGAKDPYNYQAPVWYDQHGLTGNYTIDAFAGLWDSTIKPNHLPRYGWEANPWVWVIEFEKISKKEAGLT